MNDTFKKDLYRYYGTEKETLKQRLFRPPEIQFLYIFRCAQNAKNIFSKIYYRLRFRKISKITHIQIPVATEIGKGLCISHTGKLWLIPERK